MSKSEAAEEYRTTNTILAAYILNRTRCKFHLHRNGSTEVTIVLSISKQKADELELDFVASEYNTCRAIERTLTDKIRKG